MKQIFFCLLALTASSAVSALPKEKREGGVIFEGRPPKLDYGLPLFRLADGQRFPEDKFLEILKKAAPNKNIKVDKTTDGSYKYHDGELLVGLYEQEFGETTLFPDPEALTPGDFKLDLDAVAVLAKDKSIIPPDDTKVSIVIGSRLSGSQQKIDQKPGPRGTYLLEGIIQRVVELPKATHPVCGPGSKASFSFGADGFVKSLTHRWNAAKTEGPQFAALDPDSIVKLIAAQFEDAGVTAGVTVHAVDFCYFDSAAGFLQPVFRFNATVPGPAGAAARRVEGYVPATGKAFEDLPPVLPRPAAGEAQPAVAPPPADAKLAARGAGAGVRVGRYLQANNTLSQSFVKEAVGFWDGLRGGGAAGAFVDAQYYWDSPWTYADPTAAGYINAVQLGFSDGHGNHHLFETDDFLPSHGLVRVPGSLATKGFGASSTAGAQLAYWVLAECSVIPSEFDFPADPSRAYAPWWPVFKGMRAAVGFRDLTVVSPENMKKAGRVIGQGASVVNGWMTTMLATGKTSAVTVCDHTEDNVYQNSGIGIPDCLRMWWYE